MVTITGTVSNAGPSAVIAVDLIFTVGQFLGNLMVSVSPPVVCPPSGNTRTCQLGSLAPGESKTVTLRGNFSSMVGYAFQISRALVANHTDPNSTNHYVSGVITGSSATTPPPTTPPPTTYACSNGKDDDGDGKVDYPADPGCTSSSDADETDAPPSNCHASYPDFCIPPPPPDKDCGDFSQKNFTVRHDVPDPDPHRLDGSDNDGRGCEG